MPHRAPLTVTLLLLALALSACGGGGSDTVVQNPVQASPNAALFDGTYHHVSLVASEDFGSETMRVWWGAAFADGVSQVAGDLSSNELGLVGSGFTVPYGSFAVEDDLRFSIESEFAGLDHAVGGITPEGDVAFASYVEPGTTPRILTFVRRAPGHDDALLGGNWRYVSYNASAVGANTAAGWGEMILDGAGGGTGSVSFNTEGIVAGPAMIGATYSTFSDGRVHMQLAGGFELRGGVGFGGNLMILAGGATAGDNTAMYVFVRAGAGMSDADLVDAYTLVGMSQAIGLNAYTVRAGRAVADGMGAADLHGLLNREGVVEPFPTEAVTTTVGPTGLVEMTFGGGETYVGGLSPDGRVVALAGPINPGSNPGFLLLLR